MRVELINQPDQTSSSLYDFLHQVLGDPGITRFIAITAWVNHRGLSRLLPDLRAFRSRLGSPGTAEIIVGIDEGGATEQGLRLAAAEFDRSSVFFTTDERTFHPKVYVGIGPEKALLLIGSNNLTPGGLFFNFEAALAVELNCTPDGPIDDRTLLNAVNAYLRRLYSDTIVCRPLPPNLETIIRDPIYRVRDEASPRARSGRIVLDPDTDREVVQRPPLFGRSAVPPRPRVPPGDPIPASQTLRPTAAPNAQSSRPPARRGTRVPRENRRAARARPLIVRRRWFKTLPASAAQHSPGPRSSVTGNLRLGQAGHGIDQTTYFRNELFGNLTWTGTPQSRGMREAATVTMDVIIDGRPIGTRTFEVSHAAWREAGQGNSTTFLHLTAISAELRATDYTDRVLTIEQLASGDFRLTIDTSETGPFVR